MALSSLTFLGTAPPGANYCTYFAPGVAPGRLTQGSLENEVSFGNLGYTNQNQNVLVFSVTASANTTAAISLNPDGTAINIDDQAGSNSGQVINYYSVNLGMNSVTGGGWSLTFNAKTKDKKTGSWVFVKSSTEPPQR